MRNQKVVTRYLVSMVPSDDASMHAQVKAMRDPRQVWRVLAMRYSGAGLSTMQELSRLRAQKNDLLRLSQTEMCSVAVTLLRRMQKVATFLSMDPSNPLTPEEVSLIEHMMTGSAADQAFPQAFISGSQPATNPTSCAATRDTSAHS